MSTIQDAEKNWNCQTKHEFAKKMHLAHTINSLRINTLINNHVYIGLKLKWMQYPAIHTNYS